MGVPLQGTARWKRSLEVEVDKLRHLSPPPQSQNPGGFPMPERMPGPQLLNYRRGTGQWTGCRIRQHLSYWTVTYDLETHDLSALHIYR